MCSRILSSNSSRDARGPSRLNPRKPPPPPNGPLRGAGGAPGGVAAAGGGAAGFGAAFFSSPAGLDSGLAPGGKDVPSNTQLGVWLCQTNVWPANSMLFLLPNSAKASAAVQSYP